MPLEYIDRPPRVQPELIVDEVKIPKPPEPLKGGWQALFTLLIPLITILGFVFASGTGNLALILPMGLAMGASVVFGIYTLRSEAKEAADKEKAYQALLKQMRQEMLGAHNTQRMFFHYNYPEVPALLEIAARKETSRFGSRIWERRPSDRDFGIVRLGIGSRPSTVVYKLDEGGDSLNGAPSWKDARRLATDSQVLTEVPITIPLRPVAEPRDDDDDKKPRDREKDEAISGLFEPARHSLGVFGKNPTQTADFARAVIAHFCTFHSSQDSRLYVIGHPSSHTSWEWAEWLPHCIVRGFGDDDDGAAPSSDQLCFSARPGDVRAFWKRIKRELDQRQIRLNETKEQSEGQQAAEITLPFLLIVVDLLGEAPENNPLKDVASEDIVATLNRDGPTLGAAILFLVDEPSKVPSDCQAMVEVAAVGEQVVFRYIEVGLNTPRYLGVADLLKPAEARQQLASRLRRLELVRPAGSDLPPAVELLQMMSLVEGRRLATVDKIPIQENWARSLIPENQEWLSVPIGLISSREARHLTFSAKEDGVHGMIAGTTGSGKSELLMTLVAGLAVRYDPRIVNFVLVDFKGGAAFEPFRKLPHVVDILTNVQGSAVERMFVAIQAVMEERAALLARSGAKDLVEYRRKVAPRLGPDDPLPKTFPHLFIIVDEFAEMIVANPDYRAQFESITRLGRAFGVSLLLATQRPAGVVSDQMRANMKLRACLRVETPDDSRELLGRPDASFLPNKAGRGYVQVGNDLLQPIQVAWAGAPYNDERIVLLRDVIWLDEEALPAASASADAPAYSALEISEALGMRPGETPSNVLDWLVGTAAVRAQRDGVPVQTKPWPDPLPEHLSLTDPHDARYLNTDRALGPDRTIVVNPVIGAWLNNTADKNLWPPFNWKEPPPLRVDIGLVDNPYRAEQRLLTIDLSTDPLVIFGASGRGKTTFVKTLLTALAVTRSPNELHIYALDFGRGGLKSMKALPHLGASIDASETARVEQMIRMLRNFINERQDRLAKYLSLADHNVKNPKDILSEIVVVIDNFAEFKESFEHLIPELMALVRDGRAFGVFFVITAGTPNDLGSKLYNLLTQRLTFSQAERDVYLDIVGRGARAFENVPGRGLVAVPVKDDILPLEFQVGVPGQPDMMQDVDQFDVYQDIAQRMDRVWTALGGTRPAAELPRSMTLFDLFRMLDRRDIEVLGDLQVQERWKHSMQPENQEWLRGPIGLISSRDIRTMVFQAQADGVHGMVAGTTGSGKSEMLQTLIAGLAIRYDPRIINFVLVDYKGGATIEPFRKLPHVVDVATNLEYNAVERIFVAIKAEMDRRAAILAKAGASDLVEYRKKVIPTLKPGSPFPDTFPHLFVVVDEFAEMIQANPDYRLQFEQITRLGRAFGVTLILATQRPSGVVSDQMKANMKFRICLRMETPDDSKELLNRPDAARLPQIAGRGYLQAGTETLTEVQVAWSGAPYADDRPDPQYPTEIILEALGTSEKPRSTLTWLVGALGADAKRLNIPKQRKPWPDPLPAELPLNRPVDASYLPDVPEDKTVLAPAIAAWIEAAPKKPEQAASLWKPFDWKTPLPLKAAIGVMDDPYHSIQRLFVVDVASDPIAVFGASGRGKSTFIKSLVLALAAQHSPRDLHFYAVDFGRGGLRSLRNLPHCGAVIDTVTPDRIEALFRMIRGMMNERQERLANYPSREDYNAQKLDNPDSLLPSAVVAIDNFSEFRENFEYLIPDLISLVRDGRQFGIHFVITATVPSELPAKLYNVLGQRITFTLPDPSVYLDVVGRTSISLPNLPGRGLAALEGQPLEFHLGMPLMEGEKDAYARLSEKMLAAWEAVGGKRPSAEIPRAITLLEMYQRQEGRRIDVIGDLAITDRWTHSMKPENQEWLSGALAMVSSKEVRSLIFSAKPGGDGVHGMVAGTTGSGKSELLQTLIAGLAIKYDPRIVNFVLVDYKGGATIEPFRGLPHVVDMATNLEGNAVDRIFVAIKAEMDRRSSILAKAGVADLVDYRKKVIPTLKPDSPFPNTFPHLFVIVDEFAEMIQANPDYKLQFEQITRLGRAFGVTLILATQRPSGAVTDQMKANMKFRLCLRVETTDDSREMLGRNDAATLPGIPGRGYLQVGGGPVSEFQAAYSGASYDISRPDPTYTADEILEVTGKQNDPPRSFLGWLVGALAAESKRKGIPPQFKPWPAPLPTELPLNGPIDATYIFKDDAIPSVVLSPTVQKWMEAADAKSLWEPFDWKKGPMPVEATMGLIDNPYLAQQRLLTVDVAGDPLLVLGASGRGKTTFLKSLVICLAAQHSPAELHIFGLDFGRGGLKALRTLPHVAGIVEGNEPERVERLFRMIRNTIDDRQRKLQAFDSLADYNAANPQNAFPAVLVVVDNVAEFKETYEHYLPELVTLVRDGRTFGVYFVMAASLLNDVPNKLFSLLAQRITFTQADPSDYTMIVGRGWTRINDVPGRGLVVEMLDGQPVPLEFQTGVPTTSEAVDPFRALVQRMAQAWEALEKKTPALRVRRPKPVEPLALMMDLAEVLPPMGEGADLLAAPIGINDLDREPTLVEFGAKGPNWMVVGPPVSGKTTTMRSLVLSLAHAYPPERVAMILVDPSDAARRFFNFGAAGDNTLDRLPHVLATVTNADELDAVVRRLSAEYDDEVIKALKGKPGFKPVDNTRRSIFVIIDHYDDRDVLNRSGVGLTGLSVVGKGKNLHLVLAGTLDIMRGSGDDLRRRVEGSRYTLVLQDVEHVRYMGIRGDFSAYKDLPPGRGFLIKAVQAPLVQIALPFVEGKGGLSGEEQLAQMIGAIRSKYKARAVWSYTAGDLTSLGGAAVSVPEGAAAVPQTESLAELEEILAMQQQLMSQATEIREPSHLVAGVSRKKKDTKSKKKG